MLGPICGSQVVFRFVGSTGSSPFCVTNTRSGLSGKTYVACDQLHPSWLGRLSPSGLGHPCTGSYGPKTSCPPLRPGTAANPSPGIFFCCPWTMPNRLLTRMTASNIAHTAASFSVRSLILSVPLATLESKAFTCQSCHRPQTAGTRGRLARGSNRANHTPARPSSQSWAKPFREFNSHWLYPDKRIKKSAP